jgi:3-hydroxyisobutyrate dehydrogenase-like beta-hydroxyacid dehydrogenase
MLNNVHIIGLGLMGTNLGINLVNLGVNVSGYDSRIIKITNLFFIYLALGF